MIMKLYFAVNAFSENFSDVYADNRLRADAVISRALTADIDTSDFCEREHISQTDSRFCIWQRF